MDEYGLVLYSPTERAFQGKHGGWTTDPGHAYVYNTRGLAESEREKMYGVWEHGACPVVALPIGLYITSDHTYHDIALVLAEAAEAGYNACLNQWHKQEYA